MCGGLWRLFIFRWWMPGLACLYHSLDLVPDGHGRLIEGAAMYPEADGFLTTLNTVINSNGLLSALLVALIVAVIGGGVSALRRRHQRARYPGRFRAGVAATVVLALVIG